MKRKVTLELTQGQFLVDFIENNKVIYYIMVDEVRRGEINIIAVIYDWMDGAEISHPDLSIAE
jgi:hypothetical protein